MFKKFILKIVLIFLFLSSLAASDAVILVTSDIHGNISSEDGGFLKLSSAIKEEKSKEGENKVILIDCGDTLQGSFEASQTKGQIIVTLLNMTEYDFWIPGNHDFDYGYNVFLDRTKEFKGKTLLSNLNPTEKSKMEIPYFNYAILKKNNVKVAIIGVTFPNINSSLVTSSIAPFRTGSLSFALQGVMPKVLRQNPDVIVLAIHGGLYNKSWTMTGELKRFPQIDLILGGHTHEDIAGKKLFNGDYYFQAGHGGQYLGKIEITIDKKKGKPEFVSKLIPMNKYKDDEELAAGIAGSLDTINKEGEKVIAYINPNKALNSGVLISKAIESVSGADIAIFGLSKANEKPSGKITLKSIYNLANYEDYVSTMRITKDELKIILEDMYKYKKKNSRYKKISSWGFNAEISKKGKVLSLVLPDTLEKKDRFLLAIPSYYIDYPTNKFPEIRRIAEKKESKYSNTKITVRDALIKYLSSDFSSKL